MTATDQSVTPARVPYMTTLSLACDQCGTEIVWTSHAGRDRPPRYCSKQCTSRARSTQLPPKRRILEGAELESALAALSRETSAGEVLQLRCIGCGRTHQWQVPSKGAAPPRYCDIICRRSAQKRRQRTRRVRLDEEPGPIGDLVLLICGRCEVSFGWSPPADPELRAKAPAPVYHSVSCKRKARAERKSAAEAAHAARVAAESAAARELLLPASHCVTCGRVANLTLETAKATVSAIEARSGRSNPVRYYQCPGSGYWHWTRMDASLEGWRTRTGR